MGQRSHQLPVQQVPYVPWGHACDRARRAQGRYWEAHGLANEWRIAAFTSDSQTARQRGDALSSGAQMVLKTLHARGVLCNHAQPCAVRPVGPNTLQVCLPNVSILERWDGSTPRVCEPWGERWMQLGSPLAYSDILGRENCMSLDMKAVGRWWQQLRQRTAFVDPSDKHSKLHSLLQSKQTRTRKLATDRAKAARRGRTYQEAFTSWLSSPRASSIHARLTPQQHGRCAFVGNGFSLKCGRAYGGEIDAADAVFRANGAQFNERVISTRLRAMGRAHSVPQFMRYVRRNSLGEERAGKRTDYRVNCLVNSAALPSAHSNSTCVVSRRWFEMPWGRELFRNTKYLCCDDRHVVSSYNLSNLQQQESAMGTRFAFFKGAPPSNNYDLDALADSSGGSALMAAISLCRQPVRVYGAGLYSEGPGFDKRYLHFYDHVGAALCVNSTAVGGAYRFSRLNMAKTFNLYRRWRRNRLVSEILMHVWHAFGIIEWRQ